MVNFRAKTYAQIMVVAAKIPGVAIFRFQALGWNFNCSKVAVMIDELQRVVGRLDPTVEWTACNYGAPPHYMCELPMVECIHTGIFKYAYIPYPGDPKYGGSTWDSYESQGEKIGEVPRGWLQR
jgi:hypothetical protein